MKSLIRVTIKWFQLCIDNDDDRVNITVPTTSISVSSSEITNITDPVNETAMQSTAKSSTTSLTANKIACGTVNPG